MDGWSLPDEHRQRLEQRELVIQTHRVPESRRRQLQMEAVFDCDPSRAFRLLTDFEALPSRIDGLERVQILSRNAERSEVAFSMKLPFPVGRLCWVNQVVMHKQHDHYVTSWSLVSGDLEANEGEIVLSRYPGPGGGTYARYRLHVATRSLLPERAHLLATRWFLPRLVEKLRTVAEA